MYPIFTTKNTKKHSSPQEPFVLPSKDKQAFIEKAHAGKIDHLFGDVKELPGGYAQCAIHGCKCPVPKVDVGISGTACTSISGERTSNSEFATCFTTGKGASGVTYQNGYRDMIPTAKPLVTFYENVKTVAERVLAWSGLQDLNLFIYILYKYMAIKHTYLYIYTTSTQKPIAYVLQTSVCRISIYCTLQGNGPFTVLPPTCKSKTLEPAGLDMYIYMHVYDDTALIYI